RHRAARRGRQGGGRVLRRAARSAARGPGALVPRRARVLRGGGDHRPHLRSARARGRVRAPPRAGALPRRSGLAARARRPDRDCGTGVPRLHAALALLELGVRATLALSYAPAFREQLVQAGILPLCFASEADAHGAAPGDELEIPGLHDSLEVGRALTARNLT